MSAKKNDEKLFDLRTLDNFQSRGLVKPADYEKYLKTLPDDEGNYELCVLEEDEDLEDDEAPEEE